MIPKLLQKTSFAILVGIGAAAALHAQQPEGIPLSAQLYTAREAGSLDQQQIGRAHV